MPDKNEKEIDILTRSADLTPTSINEQERSVICVASSETAVRRWFEGEYVDEILNVNGWILPERAPVLDCHSYWTTSDVRGSAVEYKIEDTKLISKIIFGRTAKANDDYVNVKDGHLNCVSVGYDILEYYYNAIGGTIVVNGRTYTAVDRPQLIASKTRLKEVSLCPIGADPESRMRNTFANAVRMNINENSINGRANMPEKINETAENKSAVDVEKVRAEVKASEKKRIAEITASCRACQLTDEFAQGLIDSDATLELANARIVEEVAKTRQAFKTEEKKPVIGMVADETDKVRSACTASLTRTFGGTIDGKIEADLRKSNYNGVRSPITLMRAYLNSYGIDTRFMDNATVYSQMRIQGMADFNYTIINSMNVVFTELFGKAMSNLDWCDSVDVDNFNTQTFFDLTPIGIIPDVADKGTLTVRNFEEVSQDFKLGTQAESTNLSRALIISDTFGALQTLARRYTLAYARTLEYKVHNKLELNGNLKDGKSIFHVDRNNIGTDAFSSPALTAAKKKLAKMVDANGTIIGMPAEWIIVPEDLRDEAYKVTQSVSDVASEANSGIANPHRNIKVASSAYLTNEKDWYVMCNKVFNPFIAYLNGQRSPQIDVTENNGTDPLGMNYRVYFDSAVGIKNPLYMFKNDVE